MNNHKITKNEDGEYVYRGVRFYRDDSLKGYSGHYKTWGRVAGIASASSANQKGLILIIDQILAKAEIE